jgi:hypothetical protein
MAGLLDYDKPDPLTLGLLGFSQAIGTPRSRGGGVAAALGAFPAGQMQAAEMQRKIQADELRKQLAQAQVDNYRSEAESRKRRAEQEAATAAAIRQATQGAMMQSPGSLGGGVAPGSEQGRMLLEQFGDDPQFAMQGLPGLNAALNTVGPQQQVQAPGTRFDPEEFARRLEAGGMPLEAAEYRKKLAVDDKTSVVAPGSVMVGARGDVRFSNPAAPKEVAPSDITRLRMERDALPPNDPTRRMYDQRIEMLTTRAPAASTNVTVVNRQETEEAKKVGEYYGSQYADLQKAGMSAQQKINNLDRLDSLLTGINTGALAPTIASIASYAESLGIKIDPKLGVKQAAEALSNEMALQARNPSGGAGMPGAMSDADRAFLQQIVPGLSKTPEGNKLIIETMRRLAKRDRDVARLSAEYRRKNGGMDEGFLPVLQEFATANPLFSGLQVAAAPTDGRTVSGTIGQPSVQDLLKKYGR